MVEEVSEIRYPPRNIPLGELLRVLVEEHGSMKEGLRRAKEATDSNDFESVSRTMKQLDPLFRQHIADEEAQILRLLIGELGMKGAEEEIKIFQQHRPIYGMMQTVAKLAYKNPSDLEAEQVTLNTLFENHTYAEEHLVFPKALAFNRQKDT